MNVRSSRSDSERSKLRCYRGGIYRLRSVGHLCRKAHSSIEVKTKKKKNCVKACRIVLLHPRGPKLGI